MVRWFGGPQATQATVPAAETGREPRNISMLFAPLALLVGLLACFLLLASCFLLLVLASCFCLLLFLLFFFVLFFFSKTFFGFLSPSILSLAFSFIRALNVLPGILASLAFLHLARVYTIHQGWAVFFFLTADGRDGDGKPSVSVSPSVRQGNSPQSFPGAHHPSVRQSNLCRLR